MRRRLVSPGSPAPPVRMTSHAQEVWHRAMKKFGSGKRKMTVHELIIAAKRQAESEKRRHNPMYKTWITNKNIETLLTAENNEPLRSVPNLQFREFPMKGKKIRDISPYASSSEEETSGNESEADSEAVDSADGGLKIEPKVEIKRDPEQQKQREMELEEGRRRLAAARGRRKMKPDVDANQADADDEATEFRVIKVIFLLGPAALNWLACPWNSSACGRQGR